MNADRRTKSGLFDGVERWGNTREQGLALAPVAPKSGQQRGIYRLKGSFWVFVAETRVTFVCTVRLPEGFRYNHGSRKMQRVGMVSLAGVFPL